MDDVRGDSIRSQGTTPAAEIANKIYRYDLMMTIYMWAAFSLGTLIRKFTIVVLNAAGHFASLTFAKEYNIFFSFSFSFISFSKLYCHRGKKEEIKKKKKEALV